LKQRLDAPLRSLIGKVRPACALDFLAALANAQDEASCRQLVEDFPGFVPERYPSGGGPAFPQELADEIRLAWRETHLGSKEWALSFALADSHELYATSRAPWLARTITALNIALRSIERLQICQRKDCPAPYFVGKRRYCGTRCQAAARRARKLEWWNRNKARQLRKRKEAKKGKYDQTKK
jgi:hypothetical protein